MIEEKKWINYGFDISKQLIDEDPEKDWQLGAVTPPDIAPEVDGLVTAGYAWPNSVNGIYPRVTYPINHCFIMIRKGLEKYLPKGEAQNDRQEKMDCVTRGFHNKIEEKLNYALENNRLPKVTLDFFTDNGYIVDGKFALNDRICAILSGTTPSGNSLKAPIDTICSHKSKRGIGIFPKNIINQYGLTFNQYYDKSDITQEILDLGKKSLEYISINYLSIYPSKFAQFAGDVKYLIFDNYLDREIPDDWIKQLADNYNLYSTAYKIIISNLKKNEESEETMKLEIEVVKKTNSPDFLYQDKREIGKWNRFGDADTFLSMFGNWPNQPEEKDIAKESIGSPVYLASSFWKILLLILADLFNKLRGKK